VEKAPALVNARRDALVLAILISAVMLLIWNGATFFSQIAYATDDRIGPGLQIASTALTLNVALILFGWRRYVDLQHEGELRADSEQRAAIMAETDAMTGLYNRKGFADHGHQLCAAAAERGHKLVILSIQMHRYKSINDRHGFEVGDQLLRLIAKSMQDSVLSEAVIARLSGDEFAVALELADDALGHAELVGEAILRAITRPFDIDGKMIQVGAFAGIAGHDAADARVPDLLRRADIAMDHAKSGRVARPVWFDGGMERALVAHSEIEQGIRFGLDHDQFVPYFEPQVDLATGQIIGFEVLARWNHPLSGVIGPDVFIPVAEEIGAIGRLSEKIVRAALSQAMSWDPSISISVNISPTQLADSWLAQRIVRLLTETGFPAERLVIEITESSLFADLELARSIVTSLKNQGIRLALDDFGTGFSSLSHLRSLPFDVIKIDRSFVATIHRDRESAAIVRAVTTLANAIGVPVTVEGIENAETHEAVMDFGCAVGQGWYFGKPMTGDQAEQLLHSRVAAPPAALPRSIAS
jgi:diguanylate cyclase (GGDEF)-like protein